MSVMRVAVIGAGAAGLVALRHLTKKPSAFEAVAYELADTIGGTWVYNEHVGKDKFGHPIHSSMYQNLRTNLPKEVMAFPDFPFPTKWPSFMSHELVLQYLEDYVKHFSLEHHIKFNTIVEKVQPTTVDGRTEWHVSTRQRDSINCGSSKFDAVIVCSGHYANPLIPDLPGISTFQGEVLHSHDYRHPEPFEGKTVICLGAASSGLDIAIEISRHAKQVYLAHRKNRIASDLPENLKQTYGIKEIKSNSVLLDDGTELDIDTLLFCTGYQYTYPFLSSDCNLKIEDERVTPLYQHLIHTEYPSLSFIGIPKKVCPFPQFDCQARFIMASLDGSMSLPSRKEMDMVTEQEFQSLLEKGLPARYAHVLDSDQWEYNDRLAKLANFSPIPRVIEELYKHTWVDRKENLLHYRERNYAFTVDGSFEQLRQ